MPSTKYLTLPFETCVTSVCQPARGPSHVSKTLSFFQFGSG
ncbi:MAG: hypothetical protein ABR603_02340 [Pyrinomonadaceae bacterium]